jgi:hypothetical protein
MLGVAAPPFDEMFNDRAMEIQRLVMNYITLLKGMLQSAAGVPASLPAACKTKSILHNGFPKLPPSFDVKAYSAGELEELYRDYLGAHYCK